MWVKVICARLYLPPLGFKPFLNCNKNFDFAAWDLFIHHILTSKVELVQTAEICQHLQQKEAHCILLASRTTTSKPDASDTTFNKQLLYKCISFCWYCPNLLKRLPSLRDKQLPLGWPLLWFSTFTMEEIWSCYTTYRSIYTINPHDSHLTEVFKVNLSQIISTAWSHRSNRRGKPLHLLNHARRLLNYNKWNIY